ncbi:MAG TPA: sulfatase-like hydrolase/transferase [Tahibacter sp.]|uniref:sulfatase-like hydrolase/transferase n=1 Tax=Tahibacter sp. TaxID=2056211 RepID=UPI002C252C70|nr:sulfatase-like hydrolase/transferase [Tahibacter sp.]HSX59785.1 sulfatase-like hydrolase/transferase [Tahibacter sp.]
MSESGWGAPAKRIAAELVFFALIAAAFLYFYISRFSQPWSSIAPHFIVLSAFWVAFATLRLVAARLGRAARLICATLLALALFLLLAYYAVVATGLLSWGRVTSWQLVWTYSRQVTGLLSVLDISIGLAATLTAAVVLVVLGTLWLLQPRIDGVAMASRRLSRHMFGALVLCGAAYTAIRVIAFADVSYATEGEPLSLTIFPEQAARSLQAHTTDGAGALDRIEDEVRRAYKPVADANRRNVFIFLADALRPDHMGVYGYERDTTPRIAALMKTVRTQQLDRVTAACAESTCGVLASLLSKYTHQFSNRPFTLADVLKRNGYRVEMILGGDHTNFYGVREAYGAFDSYFDGSMAKGFYMNDDKLVVDRVSKLPKYDGQPLMVWFHLMSSHALGRRHEENVRYLPAESYAKPVGRTGPPTPATTNYYDNGVLQMDAIFVETLGVLREKGYLDNAVVILAADHADMLGEHQEFMHAKSVYENVLRIPFLMFSFGYEPERPLVPVRLASQVDFAPTILRELGMDAPSTWVGSALQDPAPRRYVHFQQGAQVGLYDLGDERRILKFWRDVNADRDFTFDVTSDDSETTDLTPGIPPATHSAWMVELAPAVGAVMRHKE